MRKCKGLSRVKAKCRKSVGCPKTADGVGTGRSRRESVSKPVDIGKDSFASLCDTRRSSKRRKLDQVRNSFNSAKKVLHTLTRMLGNPHKLCTYSAFIFHEQVWPLSPSKFECFWFWRANSNFVRFWIRSSSSCIWIVASKFSLFIFCERIQPFVVFRHWRCSCQTGRAFSGRIIMRRKLMTEVQQIFIGKGKIAFFSKMFEINSSLLRSPAITPSSANRRSSGGTATPSERSPTNSPQMR